MTYLDLCKLLQQRTGTGGSDLAAVTGLTGAQRRLVTYVAEAWKDIQVARRDWTFRFNTFSVTLTAGAQSYDMDAAIGAGLAQTVQPRVLTIEKSGDTSTRKRLSLLDYSYFEDLFGDKVASSGRPSYVTVEPQNRRVKFDTLLDVNCVFKGTYEKAVQTLAATTDTPTIDAQYHDAIFYKALMKWAEFEEADSVYITARNSYDEWMQRMVNDLTPKVLVGADALA